MKFFTFESIVEKEQEDEGYSARNIREAIHQHIASLLANGQLIPQNEKLVHVEELTVGVP